MNGPKYDILRTAIEIIMNGTEVDTDDTLGAERALSKQDFTFKISFNTLLNYGIIKRKDN